MAPPSKINALSAFPTIPGRTLAEGGPILIDDSLSMQRKLAALGHLTGIQVEQSAWCDRCAGSTYRRHFRGCVVFPAGFAGADKLRKCTNCHWTQDGLGCSFVTLGCHPFLNARSSTNVPIATTPEPDRPQREDVDVTFSHSVLRRSLSRPLPSDYLQSAQVNAYDVPRTAAWLQGTAAYITSLENHTHDPWERELDIATAILLLDADSDSASGGGECVDSDIEQRQHQITILEERTIGHSNAATKASAMAEQELSSPKQSNLGNPIEGLSDNNTINRVLHTLRTKRRIVVIVGAGISTSAGIPDFRSNNGMFQRVRERYKLKAKGEELFSRDVFSSDAKTATFNSMICELSDIIRTAIPTPFHKMLASVAEEGRLLRLYTQNIDGLETALPGLATDVPLAADGPWPITIQLHGSLDKMVCRICNIIQPIDIKLFQGEAVPSCETCKAVEEVRIREGKRQWKVGSMRPRIVLYDEWHPEADQIGAVVNQDVQSEPDAVLVVGTSLKVHGTKIICKALCRAAGRTPGGITAWLNISKPKGPCRDGWDLVALGDCNLVAERFLTK